jgi:hypothetical protein
LLALLLLPFLPLTTEQLVAELAHGVRTQVGLVVVDLQSNLESKDFIQLEFPNSNLRT